MTTRRDDIHSTSFGRSASQRALQAGSVPQFYAPVTVYPVTVNVDNSDIIREISRVHERLNSLSNEAGSAAHPEAPTPDASAAAPVEHTDVPQMGRKFEYKVHNEPTNEEPASLPVIEFEVFDSIFLANFTCRLTLFRFNNIAKDPRVVSELASAEFRPSFGTVEAFTLDRFLGSTTPGANFAIGNGLGVRIMIEKKTPGQLVLPQQNCPYAGLRIESVALSFNPRIRDDSVTA